MTLAMIALSDTEIALIFLGTLLALSCWTAWANRRNRKDKNGR